MATWATGADGFDTLAGSKTITLTPAVGDLLVVVTHVTNIDDVNSVSDNQSGTYTRITGFNKNAATPFARIAVYVRDQLVASAVSHVITVNITGSNGGGGTALRLAGMSRTGSGAVRQSSGQSAQTAATTPAPVFGSAPLSTNPILGAVANSTNPATLTPRTNFTERADIGYASPTTGLETMTRDSGETATTQTWGSTSGTQFADLVVEFDASAADTRVDVSAADFLTPNAATDVEVSAADFLTPDAATDVEVSAADFLTPNAATDVEVSAADFVVPDAGVVNTDVEVSAADFLTPDAATDVEVSAADFLTPNAATDVEVSAADFLTPNAATDVEVSAADFLVPDASPAATTIIQINRQGFPVEYQVP